MATDEDASFLRDLIGYQLDIPDCKRLLKISNNDVGQAAGKFFDTDPDNLKSLLLNSEAKWDETAFGGAGYGNEDATLPTFNIDYAPGFEQYPHSTGHSRAPTRPPSRTSQRSILSTHAGDAPMESIESVQESGFIGNSRPAFGPATKDSYDASQWALVPTTTELIADSLPSQRQRGEGQPAILKPSSNFNYLPCLIPILHSIPLYRNALLTPAVSADDYWMGDEWWKGNASQTSRIIDTSIGLAESQKRDVIYETQRLMAFLDNTDRIYGSVGALLDSDAWREYQADMTDPDDDLLKFLLCWSEAYEMLTPNANLSGILKTVFSVGGEQHNTFLLDGTVTRNNARPGLDIYDVLDDALFSSAIGSAHITEIGNVLIFRLTSSTTSATDLGCRIPATLYADRYLAENKHVIDAMYKDVKQYEDQYVDIGAQIERLKWHHPKKEGSKKIESLKLLKTSMTAFEPPTDGSEPNEKDAHILAQLQHLSLSIENKLKDLDSQAQEIQKAMQEVSSHFKPLIDDGAEATMDPTTQQYPSGQTPQDAMKHPYKLCGVATRRDVVYLLHPDIKSDMPHATQWWRMQFDTESSSPTIRRDPQTLQEVIERATSESASVLLVYANEAALSAERIPLSKPLEDFVKKDKHAFLEELQKNATGWDDYNMDYGTEAQGGWDKEAYNADPNAATDFDHAGDWTEIGAREYYQNHGGAVGFDDDVGHVNGASGNEIRHFENLSEATLTPNTDMEGLETTGVPSDANASSKGVQEMVEVNGGMDALTGYSGEVLDEERMDMDGSGHAMAETRHKRDGEDMSAKHAEVMEKKGG